MIEKLKTFCQDTACDFDQECDFCYLYTYEDEIYIFFKINSIGDVTIKEINYYDSFGNETCVSKEMISEAEDVLTEWIKPNFEIEDNSITIEGRIYN